MNFTCSADANPAVDYYTLFKDGLVVNTGSLGVWSITMDAAGQFVYRCQANNSVGFGKSSDVTFNVEGEICIIKWVKYFANIVFFKSRLS